MICDISPGDICVLPFPFNDLSGKKKRPALALSKPDEYGDVRFAFITARNSNSLLTVKLGYDDYAEGYIPLPRDGYIRLDKQYSLHKDIVIKKKTRLNPSTLETVLRQNVIKEIAPFCDEKYQASQFKAGQSVVPVSGKLIGKQEIELIVESALDGWLTSGRFNTVFEKKTAEFIGVKHVLTTNSGSSANLLAFTALTSPKLGNKAIKEGDEVITVAASFPTTVNPILQFGAVPVFVDINILSCNINEELIEAAISPKTKAIMLAHTLGNPFNLAEVKRICEKYGLWLIEDCCDALGSTYNGKHVGTFGDIATLSFYPAHHITMGEGGAVFTNNSKLNRIIESFRDWGRDCFCGPGKDNTCGKRFEKQMGELPFGYDHKYTYSHLGYNLKITDMQAAIGVAQMDKLQDFIAVRRENFTYLKQQLLDYSDKLILPVATEHSMPSWFGFPITIRADSNVSRLDLLRALEKNRIATRLLFAGNITCQPYMEGGKYRVSGNLKNTDLVMNNTFWVGVYPALDFEMLNHIAGVIISVLRKQDNKNNL